MRKGGGGVSGGVGGGGGIWGGVSGGVGSIGDDPFGGVKGDSKVFTANVVSVMPAPLLSFFSSAGRALFPGGLSGVKVVVVVVAFAFVLVAIVS